eukprot:9293202-Pyramimonas_sp.AAC.1
MGSGGSSSWAGLPSRSSSGGSPSRDRWHCSAPIPSSGASVQAHRVHVPTLRHEGAYRSQPEAASGFLRQRGAILTPGRPGDSSNLDASRIKLKCEPSGV